MSFPFEVSKPVLRTYARQDDLSGLTLMEDGYVSFGKH